MRFGRTFALLTALIIAALAVAALPAIAARTAFRYDTSQRVVNACVLAVDIDADGVVDPPPNPYVIEGMRRSDLTPDDWVFENPLAPATVVEGDVPADFVVKGKQAYWVVELTDESAARLVGMDLIYLSADVIDLTPRQQDGLRAAVEAGAVLWVDNAIARDAGGNPTAWTTVVNFPWTIVFDFDAANNHALEAIDPSHSLLREPHALDRAAVTRLGDRPDRAEYDQWQTTQPDSTLTEGHYLVAASLDPSFRTVVENVAYDNAGGVVGRAPWAVATDFGAGSVLVTTGGVGRDVVEWTGEGGASNWRPSPNFLQAPDVKFALNAIQWNDRWQQARRTPRASATTVARAPFPLDIAWQYPDSTEDPAIVSIGAVVSTPVHSRNLIYALSIPSAVSGDAAYLMAFDMTPEEDRDGDNLPDDGVVTDYSLGAPYDMLWRVALPTADMTPHYSSPTVTTWTDPGTNLGDVSDDTTYPQAVLVSYVDTSTGEAWVDCYAGSTGPSGGTLMWRRQIPAYAASPTAEVIALSTPIVHQGYVYVLASEYDPALAGANNRQSTYGRAHCFELDYAWDPTDPWPADASWWVYPSELDNIDGLGTAASGTEPQRALPAFHDPAWVAATAAMYPTGRTELPPEPGAIPVVHGSGTSVDGATVDALLTFGTPVSFEWDPNTGEILIDGSVGGSQYTLVPTPLRVNDHSPAKPGQGSAALPWGIGLNHNYFTLRMNEAIASYTDTTVHLAPAQSVDQEAYVVGERYLRFSPGAAREAAIEAVVAGANPLHAQTGVAVDVQYNGLAEAEAHQLAGPVRWRRALKTGERISQPAAMGADELAVASGRTIDYRYLTPPPAPPSGSGAVAKFDASSGATRWSYDPIISIPNPGPAAYTTDTTAAAFDDETVIVGASAVDYPNQDVVSSIIGLRRQIDAEIDLSGGAAGEYPAAVHMIWPDAQIHELSPGSYNVDPWTGRLMFPVGTASDVSDIDGVSVGPVYGRVIRVEWADGTTEDHVAPDIERFHHTPGYIRLRFRPYDPATINITRPDGTAIDGATINSINPPVAFAGRNAVLDGWVDLTAATDTDGAAVLPGDELLVSYEGWSERAQAWITVPNAANNIDVERHEMAVVFGPSLSSPAVAGDTIHIGTQGIDLNLDNAFDPPAPDPERSETLLSLIWNKATGLVRSGKTVPAEQQVGVTGIPVVSGAPSVAEDNVFVGSRMMDNPANQNVGYGYVSAMAPWRVLLCDTNRIVETTGSEPSWVCTGTSSPQRMQSFIGEDLQRPFSRPAKATRLPTGNILVVDSGNHRVVEIDRAGRIVWPLDMFGYEYYTSPDNDNLKLARPADAQRYYELEQGPITGRYFPVLHTVVADTGNARVVDIATRFYNPATEVQDGRQRHTVTTVTPTYVRTGTGARGFDRVRYTSAAPINDPRTGAVVGYLCAASNLNQLLVVNAGNRVVNPFASIATAGGTAGSTWRYWAWLYDSDPSDANDVSNEPLQFENIKHVDLDRIGDTIYVAVTCTRYVGRSGAAPHALAGEGAGVFEFRIDVGSPNPADWELDQMGTGAPWPTQDPHWFFTRADYVGRPMTTITTAAATYDKRWYPVCSQRLSGDTVLITNSLSQIESATLENIGAGVRDAVMGSHIFEVETDDLADADPTNDVHTIDPDRSVPAPGEMWSDPFTQPTYAEVR